MALTIVETPDHTWRRSFANDDPIDTLDRKLAQAEALAVSLVGESGDTFRNLNDVLQDNVLWLLSDLLTEIRQAHDLCQRRTP